MAEKERLRLRVSVIVGSLDVGGTETHILRVFSSLKARGHHICIIPMVREGALASAARRSGVFVKAPKDFRLPLAEISFFRLPARLVITLLALFEELKTQKADIVCLYLPASVVLGTLAHFMSGSLSKLVAFRRSLNSYQDRRPLSGLIERKLMRYADAIVGNSAAVVRQLVEEESCSKGRVRLIYNGVDTNALRSAPENLGCRSELQLSDRDVVLTVVANLIPYKGHKDLIEAISLLPRVARTNVQLICVGAGIAQRQDLIALTSQYQLDAHVKWLGSRKDVFRIFSDSDIGVLPSHEEGFSNAILEGMAAGLPMVVTDVGGNAEAVIDGETGFVVPSKDPQALATALERLIGDAKLRESMGQAGRQRVEERFSLDSCVDAYESLFYEVLERR